MQLKNTLNLLIKKTGHLIKIENEPKIYLSENSPKSQLNLNIGVITNGDTKITNFN